MLLRGSCSEDDLKMNVKRFVWLAAFSLLCAGWARADFAPPPATPFFFIQLTGWGNGQQLNVGGSSTDTSTEGFTRNSFCPSGEDSCDDPGSKLNGGGDAIPFNSNVGAIITTDANGNATVDYENVGPNLETVTLTTLITGDQLNERYTCQSNVYSFCGFAAFDPPHITSETLEVLFTNPFHPGGIPSAVPEPRQYLLLLIALGTCLAADRFRRRARV
jgi:hypothetical protein